MNDDLRGRVVVITGASSGIGRATAHAFAREGAQLVLAARREAMLHVAAEECRQLGGTATVVVTDVSREAEVERLAARAVDQHGRIDVWFSNAGVGVFGTLEDIPGAVWRRVIETNVFGTMNSARAALRRFRLQGHGVLIHNASIVGRIAKPDSSAYATSKFALRGFSEALRQELLDDSAIHVCTVLPSVIDTPFFHHAANFSGRRVRAAPPVYTPEKVAKAVVGLALRPRAEVTVGGFGKVASALKLLLPTPMTRVNGRLLHRGFLAPQPSPPTPGSVFEPMHDDQAVRGGWRHGFNNGGVPLLATGLVGAAGLIGWLALRRRALD